jgi:hypothetical protein
VQFLTQICVPRHGGTVGESCGRMMEEMHLISAARTCGHDVVYCLKIFAATAGVRTQWSHDTSEGTCF